MRLGKNLNGFVVADLLIRRLTTLGEVVDRIQYC